MQCLQVYLTEKNCIIIYINFNPKKKNCNAAESLYNIAKIEITMSFKYIKSEGLKASCIKGKDFRVVN